MTANTTLSAEAAHISQELWGFWNQGQFAEMAAFGTSHLEDTDPDSAVMARVGLSIAAFAVGDVHKSTTYDVEAVDRARQGASLPVQGTALTTNSSHLRAYTFQFEKALALLHEGLAAADKAQYRSGQAAAHCELANVELVRGNLNTAYSHLHTALAFQQETNDLYVHGHILNGYGVYYTAQRQWSKAENAFRLALEDTSQCKNIPDSTLMKANLSTVIARVSDFSTVNRAIPIAVEAMEQAQTIGYIWGQLNAHYSMWVIYQRSHQYKKAVEVVQTAAKIAEKHGILRFRFTFMMNCVTTYASMRAFHSAIELLEQVNALPADEKPARMNAAIEYNIGWMYIYMRGNKRARAMEHWQRMREFERSEGKLRSINRFRRTAMAYHRLVYTLSGALRGQSSL